MFYCCRDYDAVWLCSDKDQLQTSDELAPDYQYSVDGYYSTRRASFGDNSAPPFMRGNTTCTEDEHDLAGIHHHHHHHNDFIATTAMTPAPRAGGHYGCQVVDKTQLGSYGTSTATPASRLCHHATPTCADCQSDYERRRVVKATAATPANGVDVTMTTNAATSSSRPPPANNKPQQRHHVYELPHVVWVDVITITWLSIIPDLSQKASLNNTVNRPNG